MSTLTNADLEAALLDLGGVLAPTPAPDLASAVRLRVEALGVLPARAPRWMDRLARPIGRPVRRGLVLALAALLVLAGIAAAIGFGLPGLRIVILGPGQTIGPPTASITPPSGAAGSPPSAGRSPAPTPSPLASPVPTSSPIDSLGLGERVDPAAADAAAGYPVLLPTLPDLGPPLGVFVRDQPPHARVAVAYAATPAIPAAKGAPTENGTPVAVIVTEFPGRTDGGYLQKVLEEGTSIKPVAIAGHPGFWIAGKPHKLLYVDRDGQVQPDTVRLVGNVLAWNDGDLTIRIEGAPDLATAMRIAGSLR